MYIIYYIFINCLETESHLITRFILGINLSIQLKMRKKFIKVITGSDMLNLLFKKTLFIQDHKNVSLIKKTT